VLNAAVGAQTLESLAIDPNRVTVSGVSSGGFPQVEARRFAWYAPWRPLNPEGCWDWWGYSGADYAVRSGVQIQAIAAMIERLEGPIRH
jgi:hypothetical protein